MCKARHETALGARESESKSLSVTRNRSLSMCIVAHRDLEIRFDPPITANCHLPSAVVHFGVCVD